MEFGKVAVLAPAEANSVDLDFEISNFSAQNFLHRTSPNMSKRKRGDDVEDDDATAAANFRQQRRIMAAFSESTKHLSRAFKLAKGLEQQKMGRRLKAAAAKKDQKDMDRINAEKVAVKVGADNRCVRGRLNIKSVD